MNTHDVMIQNMNDAYFDKCRECDALLGRVKALEELCGEAAKHLNDRFVGQEHNFLFCGCEAVGGEETRHSNCIVVRIRAALSPKEQSK